MFAFTYSVNDHEMGLVPVDNARQRGLIPELIPTDFYTGSPEAYRLCGLADSEH